MSNINQDIAAVKAKISDLEDEIAAAKKEVPIFKEYIIELTRLLIELRKEKNILLEKSNQIVTVGKLSYIY
jgi:hypothetical protein